MLRDLAPERATGSLLVDGPAEPEEPPVVATGLVAAAAAVRGVAVAISGVLLTAGLALMIWAITPASGPDATVALRGGVTAFALANLMPVSIGGATLSLPPLLLTAVPVALLVATARRGRFLPVGRYQEGVAVLTTAGVYGLVVSATTRGFSSPEAVPAGSVWTGFALALAATAAGMLRGGSAWSRWARRGLPGWARVGIRGGMVGLAALIGAGALVLSCGLILRFGTAVDIAAAAAPSWLDGLGLTMLGLAYLPNAVVAAVGYLSGVGFEIGPGTYSPLATTTVDLPGVPLLAAAPQHDGRTLLSMACLTVPFVIGYLVARPAVTRLVTRADRVIAAAVGAVVTGATVALAAVVATGGVGDGRWSTMGVNAALVGPVVAAQVGIVAVVVAAVTGWRTVPWRIRDITAEPDAGPSRRARRRAEKAGAKAGAKAAETAGEKADSKSRRARVRRGRSGRKSRATEDLGAAASGGAAGREGADGADDPTTTSAVADDPVGEPAATGDRAQGDSIGGDGPTTAPVSGPAAGVTASPAELAADAQDAQDAQDAEDADDGARRKARAGHSRPETGTAARRDDG